MKKLLPAIDIVIYIVVIGWFVQKYLKNGFKDLTDFIIPSVVSILFIYDLYSSRKKKSEKPKETQLREDKAFNLFCYILIFGSVVFQYLNNRFDWSDLILPLILLISIFLPRLQLLRD